LDEKGDIWTTKKCISMWFSYREVIYILNSVKTWCRLYCFCWFHFLATYTKSKAQ